MARVTQHKKSSKGSFDCAACRQPILKGETYHMWSLKSGRGGQLFRQRTKCGQPKRSQLTLSKLSAAYSAIESAEASISGASCFEDIKTALTDAAGEIESVRDEYQESLDNMPEGLQQGDTGQQIQEKIDALDEFANTLTSAESDIEEDDAEKTVDDEAPEGLDDAKQKAQEALDEFSL